MPYDRFIREQIAGDLIDGPDRIERLAALGFFACGPVYYGDAQRHDQYADRIDTLTRGFLGLTVACARCHDHKYDPIPTADFYALEGVFASTEYVEVPAVPREVVDAYKAAQSRHSSQGQGNQRLPEGRSRAAQAESHRQPVQTGRTQAARRGQEESWRRLRAELAGLKKNAPPHYPVIHTLGRSVAANRRAGLDPGQPEHAGCQGPPALSDGARAAINHHLPMAADGLTWRVAIASEDNPLTARVMVNRVWQHHFGRGLVATPSNFGALGERPSHPELLDWLARRFIASGWSLKALHREIMLSSAYRQSSRFDSSGHAKDPENVLALADEPPPARCRSLARRHAGRGRATRLEVRRSPGEPRFLDQRCAEPSTPRSAATTWPGCCDFSTFPTPTSPAEAESKPPSRSSSSSFSTASS